MKIVIQRTDGGVSVMQLVDPQATVDGELDKWRALYPAEYVSHRMMPDEAIPPDRTFRNAWCDETPEPVIDIDMPKAREIHREKLRQMRAPKLAALDIEYQRADEAGDAKRKGEVATKKQALRDITDDPAIEAAQTPDELKAVMPAALTEQETK